MENRGQLEIKVSGKVRNENIKPDNFDIRDLMSVLSNVEDLLYNGDKKNRPLITYDIEEGSVRNIFKTSIQYIVSFNALIGLINETKSIDYLESKTAKAIENLQSIAVKNEFTFDISTSVKNSNSIKIDNQSSFIRSKNIWAEAEFYFYGKITNAGGKEKANIHLLTEDLGTIRVNTPITFLEEQKENILYKYLGVRARGKQNVSSSEIDFSSLEFIDLIDYDPIYNESYLSKLRSNAKKSWSGKGDPIELLKKIRGSYGN